MRTAAASGGAQLRPPGSFSLPECLFLARCCPPDGFWEAVCPLSGGGLSAGLAPRPPSLLSAGLGPSAAPSTACWGHPEHPSAWLGQHWDEPGCHWDELDWPQPLAVVQGAWCAVSCCPGSSFGFHT